MRTQYRYRENYFNLIARLEKKRERERVSRIRSVNIFMNVQDRYALWTTCLLMRKIRGHVQDMSWALI